MRPTRELTISESTGRLIDILRKYRKLIHTDILEALGLTYDSEYALIIFDEQIQKEYEALEDKLKRLVMTNISENLILEEPTEI